MGFESFSKVETAEDKAESYERKKLRVHNDIQSKIMALECTPAGGLKEIQDWLQENSENFAEAFDSALSADPQLLDLWDAGGNEQARLTDLFISELKARAITPGRRAA